MRRRAWVGYLVAVTLTLATLELRLGLGDLLTPFPLLLPTGAVTIAAFLAGWRSGTATAVMTGLVFKFLFIAPVGTLMLSWPGGVIAIGFYVMLCVIIIGLMHATLKAGDALTASEAALQQANADLETRVTQRTGELADSRARMRTVFETSYQFQGLVTPQGVLLDANHVSLDSIGARLEDVVGRAFWNTPWFTGTPGMSELAEHAVQAAALGETVRREIVVFLNGGGPRTFEFILRPIHDPDGTVVALVSEAVELTERRQAEEALRQSQKMEAIGQLTGGVAHDFNNLLTVIRGAAEVLRRPDLPEVRRERYLSAISESSDRAAKLTGQLLAFARRQTLRPEAFDVADSLKGLAEMTRTLLGSRMTLDLAAPNTACFVRADLSQFDTAIVNMMVNARDAMGGEGRLVIGAEAVDGIPAVRAHPAVAGDFVAVRVADTGAGIRPDDLERIFEPFFTTKVVGSGTGLGLSQVFGFAKQSHGEVLVESTPGAGSTFTLYLPRVQPEVRDAEAPSEEAQLDGAGACVLLVEDNHDVGAFAVQALEEIGYRSVLACDAAGALAELDRDADQFDVVFTDVVMPGMSGLELAEVVRDRHPGLPVILASGYSHVLAQNGPYGFELLQKPYSVVELSRALGQAVAARRRAMG